jgi:hypothetical protein
MIMSKNSTKISILLPTRGRTTQLLRSVESLVDLADDSATIQWLFGFDNDDMDTYQWFQDHVLPKIVASGAKYTCMGFEPLGYIKLNEYVNQLAAKATGDWFVFWNDDAVMKTSGWDTEIVNHTGEFCLQAFDTHNKHPYSIFPIVPREWFELIGHLSLHQLNDAWLSQIAWMLDIVKPIPVEVLHDRADLTGNNRDATYKNRIIYEGNVDNPLDFNHNNFRETRIKETCQIAKYLLDKGYDLTHWKLSCEGKTNVWGKMMAADVNNHMQQFAAKSGTNSNA